MFADMSLGRFLVFTVAVFCFVLSASAQSIQPSLSASESKTNPASIPVKASDAEEAIRQQQAELSSQLSSLMTKGEMGDKLAAWQQESAAKFSIQVQRAEALSSAHTPLMPLITEVNVPEGASPDLTSLMLLKADLGNRAMQLHAQLQASAALGDGSSLQNEGTFFKKQNAAELEQMQEISKGMAEQVPSGRAPEPGPVVVPDNATPQLKAFLIFKNQLMREQAQLYNQFLTAEPLDRDAIMRQWTQQNSARFSQLQEMAKSLAQTKE